MATPREIIERIRRTEYLIGVDLSPEGEEGAQNMRRNLNNALKALSEDLYSKDTHFALELVQNAEDNQYAPGVVPELSFHLSTTELVVENNELGFTEPNVRAICRVAQSTKPKRAGFIGEKGIGFKSVFTVTDRPEIHSNGFHFHFDRTDPEHVLGYVVPHWCDDRGFAKDRTTIVLPAKQGSAFSTEKLSELNEELLLFLPKLRTIVISDDIAATRLVYRRSGEAGVVTLTSERTSETAAASITERRFRSVIHVYQTGDLKEEKRQDVEESAVVLAFPISEDGGASADATYNVFAFLPVRDFGFRFLIQGDFLLSSNREDIHRSSAWNKRLRESIPRAFMRAIETFKADKLLSNSFLQYVPRQSDITDPFFAEVARGIIDGMKQFECVQTASGAWRRPGDVLIADDSLKALYPNDELRRILGFEYLSELVQAPVATLQRIGVTIASIDHLMMLLEKDDCLPTRPSSWLCALYEYCDRKITTESAIRRIQRLSIIKLDSGEVAKLASSNVYFPLRRGRRFGFEGEFAIVEPAFVSGDETSEDVVRFLRRVGVRDTEPFSLIRGHILPRHAGDEWRQSTSQARVGHVAYIKEHLPEYLKSAEAAGESPEQALTGLRTGLWIQSKKELDGKTYFGRPSGMHLGPEYRPPYALERLLGAAGDRGSFVSQVYLAGGSSKNQSEDETEDRRAWREFFYRIGVNMYPAVVRVLSGTWSNCRPSPELSALLNSPEPKVRRVAIEIVDSHWDYYSPFLEERETSRRGYTRDSEFLQLLRSVKAVTKRRGDFLLSETYLDTEFVRAVFGDAAAYLDAEVSNAEFLDTVGVTHRVDGAACVKRLDQLRGMPRIHLKDIRLIYRELERRFDDEETVITRAFHEAARIYVPSLDQWLTTGQVVWESSGAFVDSRYPPLSVAYREHQGFFCRSLKVARQADDLSLVQALTKLDEYGADHSERKSEAIKIYRRLARSLRAGQEDDSVFEPDWLERMRVEAVFLDHADRLVDAANDLYIADEPRLAEAFKAHERISLLDVDPWMLPPLQDLLSQCGIRKLSAVATCQLRTTGGVTIDVQLTDRVRRRCKDLLRLFYARAPGEFERARRQGSTRALSAVEVRAVQSLEIEAEVSGCRVRVPTDTHCQGNIIYLQAGTKGRFDKVAQELCVFMGADPSTLSESVYRVLAADHDEDVQQFFDVKGVPEIPVHELEVLVDGLAEGEASGFESQESHSQDEGHFDETPLAEAGSEFNGKEQGISTGSSSYEIGEEGTPVPAEKTSDVREPVQEANTPEPAEDPTHGVDSRPTADAPRRTVRHEERRRSSGRLLSYVEPASQSSADEPPPGPSREGRDETARAAVAFVLETERGEGREVVEMPFLNEGFDIQRRSSDGEEYLEVKGLSGVWGAEGISLTPPELRMAERQRERYWLYVVEYANDLSRRRLYKIQNPFGKTNQFRFDSGWKGTAAGAASTIQPTEGKRISIDGLGSGTILRVISAGVLQRVSVQLDSGEELTRTFDPLKMVVSNRT